MAEYRALGPIRVVTHTQRTPVVANGVLGMLLFVITEAMLFAGLISAFTIYRASAIVWPPPGQPRLPLELTLANTAVLLSSGLLLYLCRRRFRRDPAGARALLLGAAGLGLVFVLVQGYEWVRLIAQGLTLTSSPLGSFFYLIVGLHALHAVVAAGVLVHAWSRLRQGWLSSGLLASAEVFWYFVVGVWPVLYWRVYL